MQLLEKIGLVARHYYVYVLYINVGFGREYWLYVGKGKGNRVNVHLPTYRTKMKKGRRLDAKERLMLLAEDLGYEIHTRIIKSDLTEDEAYNLEGKTMREYGLLNRGNVAYPHREKKNPRR